MRVPTFSALLTAVVVFGAGVHLNALQSNPTPPTSPQAKPAQITPATAAASNEDPTKKLGVFVGKWETEGAFTSGQKTSTTLECRWSPQGSYLVCDQLVNMGGEHRQFTVYSYDSKSGNY